MTLKNKKHGVIYLSDFIEAKYYLFQGHLNVIRVVDVDYAYLNHETGEWVSDNWLFRPVSGCGGDASTHEITLHEAQRWVKENCPDLTVEWL